MIAPLDTRARRKLRSKLDALVDTLGPDYLDRDPLWFLHRYEHSADQEVVGLVAAALAYGRVTTIKKSVARVLDVLGDEPHGMLRDADPAALRRELGDFKHRFNDADDVALLLHLIAQQLRRVGTLGALFAEGYEETHATVVPALTHFVETILAGSPRPLRDGIDERASVRYLLTSPRGGSACKRMLMYMRWMIRSDGLDLGLWADVVPASKLLMPLDTHTFRIGRYLGLLERRTPDLEASRQMTDALRALHGDDPVRYDFALAHLGILDLCPSRRDARKCADCSLFDVCRLR